MERCPKCGSLAYFDSYFNSYLCNTCEHRWKEPKEVNKMETAQDNLGSYVYLVVKSDGEMITVRSEENVLVLVIAISRSKEVTIKHIMKVHESGTVDMMDIRFTDGKLQLITLPECKGAF